MYMTRMLFAMHQECFGKLNHILRTERELVISILLQSSYDFFPHKIRFLDLSFLKVGSTAL